MDASPLLGAALGFALLLGTAAWRKFSDFGAFSSVIADYRIVPQTLLRPTGVVVATVEAALALLWLAAPWDADAALAAGIGTGVLMAAYGAAITANLVRGRSWIDCGCGSGDQLTWGLVARNALLAGLAIATLAVRSHGSPDWADAAVAVPVLGVATLLYLATGTLLGNSAAMRTWREA